MTDDRLTPEERAVIEAAEAWHDDITDPACDWADKFDRAVIDAVDAYRKATAPPEPFERIVVFDSNRNPEGVMFSVGSADHILVSSKAQVWRCTVTPTERVR